MNREKLNRETILRSWIVFSLSSILGYLYTYYTEPFAVKLGFRDPWNPYMFPLIGVAIGLVMTLMYLNLAGVIQDENDATKTNTQKLKEFLLGIFTSIIVLGLFLIIKIYMR